MNLEEIELFGGNSTGNGTSIFSQIADGGVKVTFIINLILAVLLVSGYVLCLQPNWVMFNDQKKRKLLDKLLSQHHQPQHQEQEQEQEEEEEVNGGDGDIQLIDTELEDNNCRGCVNSPNDRNDEGGDTLNSSNNNNMKKEDNNFSDMKRRSNTLGEEEAVAANLDVVEASQQQQEEEKSGEEVGTPPSSAKGTTNKFRRKCAFMKSFLMRKSLQFVKFWYVRFQFLWSTLQTLIYPNVRRKDREYLTRTYGRDLATYVFFQQQMIYVVTLCSFIGMSVLLPVHLSGTIPPDQASTSGSDAALLLTSVNMRITQPYILYVHVLLAIIFIILFFTIVILRFLCSSIVSEINYQGSDEERPYTSEMSEYSMVKMTDWNTARPLWYRMGLTGMSVARSHDEVEDISKHVYVASPFCVSIKGIPPLMNQQAFIDIIHAAAKKIPHERIDKAIVKVVLIPNLQKRVTMEEKLIQLKEQLDSVKHEVEMKPSVSNIYTTICCGRDVFDGGKFHVRSKVDAIEYYTKHIEYLERDISKWDELYNESYRLVANQTKGESSFLNDSQYFYQSLVNKKRIKPPKSSGYGVIVFNSRKAAKKFYKYHSGPGIRIRQKDKKTKLISLNRLPLSFLKPSMKKQDQKDSPDTGDMVNVDSSLDNGVVSSNCAPDTQVSSFDSLNESKSIEMASRDADSSIEPDQLQAEDMRYHGDVPKELQTVQFEIVNQKRTFLDHFRRLDYFSMFSLRVERTQFEPEDMELRTVFDFQKGGFGNFWRRVALHLVLIVFFVLFCSPLALASGIQSFLDLKFVQLSTKWLLRLTGTIGDLVFQYIPSLLVLIATSLMPSIIYLTAIYSKHGTHGSIQRKITERSYIYLVLSTLILPSLLLTSLDGVIKYFTGAEIWEKSFQNLFLPSSGSFFVNLILQKGLLKNSLDLYRIGNLIFYVIDVRCTQAFWRWLVPNHARYMTPLTKLKAAEQTSMYIESEYAYLHWMTSIVMAYSVFSPIVLPCGLLYFVYKYFIDRAVIIDTYGHRKDHSIAGATLGLKNDFIAHQKMAVLNMKLVFANCFIFTAFQCFFYGAKVVSDRRFIPHTAIMAILSFILLLSIPMVQLLMWRIRRWNIKRNNYKSDDPLTPSMVSKWYEPSTTFQYILPTSQKNQWFQEKRKTIMLSTSMAPNYNYNYSKEGDDGGDSL